jgi:uncharacterized membrane protein
MRTVTGIVILIGAAVAGAFLIPMLSRKSTGGAGSLDKAASDAGSATEKLADSTLEAAAIPVGYAAELIDEASEVPFWTWLVPIGGPIVYAVGQEIYEEFPDYTGVEED